MNAASTQASQQDIEEEIDRKFNNAWSTPKSYLNTVNKTQKLEKSTSANNLSDSFLKACLKLGSKEKSYSGNITLNYDEPKLAIRSDIFI